MLVKRSYKIDRRYIFFTFPKSEILPGNLISGLLSFFNKENVTYIIVGAEEHKDGTPHLHCLISLTRTIRFQVNTIKKHLKIKHFNDAGPVRSMANTLQYVTKGGAVTCYPEGLDYLSMIDSAKRKKGIKADIFVTKLRETEEEFEEFFTDILDSDLGGYVHRHAKQCADVFKIYHSTKKKRSVTEFKFPELLKDWITLQNPPTKEIFNWLLNTKVNAMKLGDKHLYIYGPTMSGKTSFLAYLIGLGLKIYSIPKNETFFDGINDEKWDLAVMDEVRGKDATVQFWNQWCDACLMPLKIKGKQAVLHTKIIPTIILSNYSALELYPKVAEGKPEVIYAFMRRWQFVEVGPTFGLINLPK